MFPGPLQRIVRHKSVPFRRLIAQCIGWWWQIVGAFERLVDKVHSSHLAKPLRLNFVEISNLGQLPQSFASTMHPR